jgi:hypothetical protein
VSLSLIFHALTPDKNRCTTNYDGTVIQLVDTVGFANCIVSCADYNRANGAGSCIAVTFNGPNDNALGQCTQFSAVTDLQLAYEEGNVQDSALLVRSPNGTIFATPRPGPSFSGQPSQGPTVVPVPSPTDSTTTVFTTSIVTVVSCPSGVPDCPLNSITNTVGPASTSSSPIQSVSTIPTSFSSPGISLPDGGTRPGSSITVSASNPITSITTIPTDFPTNTVAAQLTFTKVVTYTVFEVQAVAYCPSTPGPCSQTTTTGARVGYRTQLSCTPGVCASIQVVDAVAGVADPTCVETA